MSGIQSNKANKAAGEAAKAGQVDINALDAQARRIAQQNAQESAALEQAMTPEVSQLRRDSVNQVLGQMNPNGFDEYSQRTAMGLASSPVQGGQTPLLQAAIAKVRANLAAGGNLSPEVQNAVTRRGLATSGTVSGGLGLGRDIVARDLGLTSMDIERQRLQEAAQLGGQEFALSEADTNRQFNNRSSIVNSLQLLQGVQGNQFNRALGAAQFGQGIQQPVVGLDPSAVVNLTVGNANNQSAAMANKANMYGAQSQGFGQLAGQMGGMALLNYNNSGIATTPNANYYNTTQRPNNNVVGFG